MRSGVPMGPWEFVGRDAVDNKFEPKRLLELPESRKIKMERGEWAAEQ